MPTYVYRRPPDYYMRIAQVRRAMLLKLVDVDPPVPTGRVMSSLAGAGGLASRGGIAGKGGGLAG